MESPRFLGNHDSDAAGGKLGHQNSWQEKMQPGTHSPMGMSMMLKAGWKPGQALGRNPGTFNLPFLVLRFLDMRVRERCHVCTHVTLVPMYSIFLS
jgi:hypothetical protein